MSALLAGVALSIVAGVLNGSFATPTKAATNWAWENIWGLWGVVAMLVFPWALVAATIPHAGMLYSSIGARQIWLLALFGAGFGLAQIFFGLGVAAVGIALTFAIAIGISTAFGSIVPFLSKHADRTFTREGFFFFLGIVLMLVGIALSAIAGREKEQKSRTAAPASQNGSNAKRISFATGLTLCILAGLGTSLGNFGVAFCSPTVSRAVELGASLTNKYNAIWAPLYTASFAPFIIYCIYLWRRYRSFHLYAAKGTAVYWIYGVIMAALSMGGSAVYGIAASRIGEMGPVVGWPLFMSVIIITSSAWGFLTGEWEGAGKKSVNAMLAGIAILILGFITLAYSGTIA